MEHLDNVMISVIRIEMRQINTISFFCQMKSRNHEQKFVVWFKIQDTVAYKHNI